MPYGTLPIHSASSATRRASASSMRSAAASSASATSPSLAGISESAVSHQLRLLRSMRLVRPRRAGRLVYYALDDQHILELLRQAHTHVEEPTVTTCTVCELHAESVFKIEGMDCHEEVAILERRLKRLAGLEALDADVLGQRLSVKYDAAKLEYQPHRRSGGADRACAPGSSTRSRGPQPARHVRRDALILMSGVLRRRRHGRGARRRRSTDRAAAAFRARDRHRRRPHGAPRVACRSRAHASTSTC